MSPLLTEIEAFINEWAKLRNEWNSTNIFWRDKTKNEFELKYWNEFSRIIPLFINELKSTDELLDIANNKLGIER